jgi:hypothetical protein
LVYIEVGSMTVTYKTLWDDMPNVKIPVLHRIRYNSYNIDKDELISWLKKNCKGSFYHSLYGFPHHYMEFEDDEDAVMFALRWGS